MKRFYFIFIFVLGCAHAWAGAPVFNNITKSALDTIVGEFSANAFHTTVSPLTGSKKALLGFAGAEAGMVAGATRVPGIGSSTVSTKEIDTIYHSGIFALLNLPYGITPEVSFLPPLEFGNIKRNYYGGALRWNMTDVFLKFLPFNFGTRLHFSNVKFEFSQPISGANVTVKFDDTIWGGSLALSKKVLILEPYAGAGFIQGDGDLSISGTGTFFNTEVTTGQSASSSETSSHLYAGVQFTTLFLGIGAEYSRVFDTDRFTGKLSVRF
ncbi:MAG: hypothetical protein HYY61_00610 [Deltaproteobacteria bacterium]|nr:hypothetical protein [Deltaproteobacteria bacterium]